MSESAHITITEAAKRLGVHRNTIERKIKRGEWSVTWAPGDHGPIRLVPLWQVDGLPAPEGWSPDDHAGPDLTHAQPTSAPAVVEPPAPVLDLAPIIASHDRLVSDLRELERTIGRQDAELAALRAELARIKESPATPANAAQKRTWRFWERV